MASSPKLISILLIVALFSMQVLARDSQFFSKVSSNNDKETTEIHDVNPTKNDKKQQEPEQDPMFVPETQNGGYALYGHESGQFSPSTSTTAEPTTYEPYTTVATGYVPKQENSNLLPEGNDNKNRNYKYYNRNTYDASLPQEGNSPPHTSFDEKTYTTNNDNMAGTSFVHKTNNNNQYENNNYHENKYENNNYHENKYENNNNNQYYNTNENMADTASFAKKTYTTKNRYNNDKVYNNERQGMSDTRFLENGKYYYDLNSEIDQNRMKQGMSDTRFLENGKYYYDLNSEIDQNRVKQGMSDTRFLKNGKYFHDLKNENKNYNYNPNQYQHQHRQNSNSNSGRSYYGNNNYEYNNMREIQNADVDNFNGDQQFKP